MIPFSPQIKIGIKGHQAQKLKVEKLEEDKAKITHTQIFHPKKYNEISYTISRYRDREQTFEFTISIS